VSETDQAQSNQQVADALGEELRRIHRESYGAGAESVTSHLMEGAVLVFLDGLELLPSEQFLIAQGEASAVIEVRQRYQQAIGSIFTAAVERATGRRVTSFFSDTRLDPNYAMEVFRLGDSR